MKPFRLLMLITVLCAHLHCFAEKPTAVPVGFRDLYAAMEQKSMRSTRS